MAVEQADFSLLEERGLRGEEIATVGAAWSPSMDVLCGVSEGGTVWTYRLNWQKLWEARVGSSASGGRGRCTGGVAWDPHGKIVAVSCGREADDQTPGIAMLDIETGAVCTRRPLPFEASLLTWTSVSPGSGGLRTSAAGERLKRVKRLLLPRIMQESSDVGQSNIVEDSRTHSSSSWTSLQDSMQVDLLVAGGEGQILVLARGAFRVASLDLNDILKFYSDTPSSHHGLSFSPVAVSFSSDCSKLAVVIDIKKSEGEREGISGIEPGLHLALYDTNLKVDGIHSSVLEASTHATDIYSCLQNTSASIANLIKQWETNAMKPFLSKFLKLEQLLKNHGMFETTLSRELYSTLMGASMSPALHQWLTLEMGEADIRRMARTIETSLNLVHITLVRNIATDVREALFRVGELRALAEAAAIGIDVSVQTDGIGVGYDIDMLANLEAEFTALLLCVEKASRHITQVSCQYRAFFAFLIHALRSLGEDGIQNDQSPNAPNASLSTAFAFDSGGVVAFLNGQFMDDRVKLILAMDKGKGNIPVGKVPNTVSDFHSEMSRKVVKHICSSELALPSRELGAQVTYLLAKVAEHLLCPEENVILPPFQLSQVIGLERWTSSTQRIDCLSPRVIVTHSEAEDGMMVSFISEALRGDVALLRIDGSGKREIGCICRRSPDRPFLALQPFTPHKLATLTNSDSENSTCLELHDASGPWQTAEGDGFLTEIISGSGAKRFIIERNCRSRDIAGKGSLPFAVSGSRGLAFIIMNQKRVLLFDMVNDDGEDEDEEDS